MVYYRKYRSQTIDELDSESLRKTLNSIFVPKTDAPKVQKLKDKDGTKKSTLSENIADTIPHAFLFTGPKGLGKTSTARIVAKVVNCVELKIENGQVILCQNHCEPCKTIANGTNMDVLEIDGASNRGIDEVRDLREKVRLSPVSSLKKVYIIDEVHMLTTEAFNALLKTIEEPPSHVLFIFCTTESYKVPATILSRCFHVPFQLATATDLVRSFERIVKGEKLNIDQDTLTLVASLADGSFRDGSKILQELALLANGAQITKEIVENRFHAASIPSKAWELLSHLSHKNTKAALALVDALFKEGVDIKYFSQRLIEQLHFLVLVEVGVEKGANVPSDLPKLELIEIKKIMEFLVKAYGEIKYSALPQLPLELAIIEYSSISANLQAKKESEEVFNLKHVAANSKIQEVKRAYSVTVNAQKPVLPEFVQNSVAAVRTSVSSATASSSNEVLEQLIAKTKLVNQSVAGVLRGCVVKSYDGKALVIEARYKFHKERLDDVKAMELLQQVSEEIAGNKVSVSVLLHENML